MFVKLLVQLQMVFHSVGYLSSICTVLRFLPLVVFILWYALPISVLHHLIHLEVDRLSEPIQCKAPHDVVLELHLEFLLSRESSGPAGIISSITIYCLLTRHFSSTSHTIDQLSIPAVVVVTAPMHVTDVLFGDMRKSARARDT